MDLVRDAPRVDPPPPPPPPPPPRLPLPLPLLRDDDGRLRDGPTSCTPNTPPARRTLAGAPTLHASTAPRPPPPPPRGSPLGTVDAPLPPLPPLLAFAARLPALLPAPPPALDPALLPVLLPATLPPSLATRGRCAFLPAACFCFLVAAACFTRCAASTDRGLRLRFTTPDALPLALLLPPRAPARAVTDVTRLPAFLTPTLLRSFFRPRLVEAVAAPVAVVPAVDSGTVSPSPPSPPPSVSEVEAPACTPSLSPATPPGWSGEGCGGPWAAVVGVGPDTSCWTGAGGGIVTTGAGAGAGAGAIAVAVAGSRTCGCAGGCCCCCCTGASAGAGAGGWPHPIATPPPPPPPPPGPVAAGVGCVCAADAVTTTLACAPVAVRADVGAPACTCATARCTDAGAPGGRHDGDRRRRTSAAPPMRLWRPPSRDGVSDTYPTTLAEVWMPTVVCGGGGADAGPDPCA